MKTGSAHLKGLLRRVGRKRANTDLDFNFSGLLMQSTVVLQVCYLTQRQLPQQIKNVRQLAPSDVNPIQFTE
jgi:hypothetical protein